MLFIAFFGLENMLIERFGRLEMSDKALEARWRDQSTTPEPNGLPARSPCYNRGAPPLSGENIPGKARKAATPKRKGSARTFKAAALKSC